MTVSRYAATVMRGLQDGADKYKETAGGSAPTPMYSWNSFGSVGVLFLVTHLSPPHPCPRRGLLAEAFSVGCCPLLGTPALTLRVAPAHGACQVQLQAQVMALLTLLLRTYIIRQSYGSPRVVLIAEHRCAISAQAAAGAEPSGRQAWASDG